MATSLAEQLKRLAIPKSLQQKELRSKPSLLFDSSEAANLDRNVVYEIGASGLEELIELDEAFAQFSETLFDITSIHMQRVIEDKDINKNLDKEIRKFLHLASPYFLLKPTHKALEWLILRYSIHELNVEDLMGLILPYHETNIFVKVLQLIDLKLNSNKHWAWLRVLQKKGLHLPKAVLVKHAISDSSFLRFICKTMVKTVKQHRRYKSVHKVGTLITFYCTTLIDIIAQEKINDHQLTVILPSLMECLSSTSVDMKASGYMIVGQLLAKNQLSIVFVNEIMTLLLNDESGLLMNETALLLVLIVQSQKPAPDISRKYLIKLTWLNKILVTLSKEGVMVEPLVLHIIKCCLESISSKKNLNLVEIQVLVWSLAIDIPLDVEYTKKLLKCIDANHSKLDESIQNNKTEKDYATDLLKWFDTLMQHVLYAHSNAVRKGMDDPNFSTLIKKWKSDILEIEDEEIENLLKVCCGDKQESTWLKLRPLLLKKIQNEKIFQALCKVAPSYDNLVLLLCLEKILKFSQLNPMMWAMDSSRIFKSNFGKTNSHLKEIWHTQKSNKSKFTDKMILDHLTKHQSESDNPIEFEAWLAAIEELKTLDCIRSNNPIWDLSLTVLNSSLPVTFSAVHALQLMKTLLSMERRKIKSRFNILKSVISYMSKQKNESKWFDLGETDPNVWLKVKVFEYILKGLRQDLHHVKEYNELYDEFYSTCFSRNEFIVFIGAVCFGCTKEEEPGDNNVSPQLQLYALHLAWQKLGELCQSGYKECYHDALKSELNQVLFYLLGIVTNPCGVLRTAALKVIEVLVNVFENFKIKNESVLLKWILKRSEEINANPDQLNVVLFYGLSPSETVQATLEASTIEPLKNCRENLLKVIVADDTPTYVVAKLLQILDNVNSQEIMLTLVEIGNKAISSEINSRTSKKILLNYWSRLNETTAQILEVPEVWNLAEKCMKHPKCNDLCPAVTFLKSITKEVFEKLTKEKRSQLLTLMISIRSQTDSSTTSSAIASAVKKIHLDSDIVAPLIKQMTTSMSQPGRRRDTTTIVEAKEWKDGISLLELLQSKKKITNSHLLLEPLFSTLKFCLDQDEQTAFEYVKQLVLGALLFCCQKLPPEDGTVVDESTLNVELAVNCLRASTNPQTHHHALLLLSCLSSLLPNQVMHNIMAIFTFMGTSVARLDDEHSVKIVTQVVDTVVPVLVKTMTNRMMETNEEESESDKVIAEVLRVFVWALRDIPQHRRTPLFSQLLTTLGPERSLWIFLVLLFENYVLQGDTTKNEGLNMPPSLYLGLQLTVSMSPDVILTCVWKIINYLIDLPLENMKPERSTKSIGVKVTNGLFDFDKNTPKELRHFAYTIITFLNSLVTESSFVAEVTEVNHKDPDRLTPFFKNIVTLMLKYIPIVLKQYDKQQTKYWKAMIHQANDLLDKLVSLVDINMLVKVIRKLLHKSVGPLRRKAMELLNISIQGRRDDFSLDEKNNLRPLIEPLMEIIETIGEEKDQESELLQQTALISIKLLGKLLASDDKALFKDILTKLCKKCKKSEGHVLGSVVLTISELVACLKAHSVSEVPVLIPLILKITSKYLNDNKVDLGLVSVTVALHRIVDILPNFLSRYLEEMLFTVCMASVKWHDNPELSKKLTQIRQKLSNNVPHRVLIPAISKSYNNLIKKGYTDAIEPLLSTLSESYSTSPDMGKLVSELTQFFMAAFQFRSNCETESKNVSLEVIDKVERAALEAFIPLVLKLSESTFKPIYYQLFHWSSEHTERLITFYRLSSRLAESLKGLFVLFAGHFLQNAATLLDSTNVTKAESNLFGDTKEGEAKTALLLEYIIKTLHSVFLFDSADSSNFLNKDKFEVLLHPLVDQLDNTLGGMESLEKRTNLLLTPCLAQMALAVDDTLWKSLNYQILLKAKSNLAQVRIAAIETIVAVASKLGQDYLLLLPETIGSLAELLEDEDERVENAMKSAIHRLEDVLGQPIREYFQ